MQTWASGEAYEDFMGRWSSEVARLFVAWLAPSPGQTWLDIGCGTGALTSAILDLASPHQIIGLDPSTAYLALGRERFQGSSVRLLNGAAQALPFGPQAFDIAVSGLVLNFVPDPGLVLNESRRVLQRGGAVALYVWDYAVGMQRLRFFWDAAVSLDPAAEAHDEGRRSLCHPDQLNVLFESAGFRDVEVEAITIPTVFSSFEAYWAPFTAGQGPAGSYLQALSSARREALRSRLAETLPRDSQGVISLMARAWAVRGVAPST
ncbi:MAG: methyltransferase domain-containing protein [Dehalococcoidia bacterium]